jgi:hypothetical protein
MVMCRVCPVHSPTYAEFTAGAAVLVGVALLAVAVVDPAPPLGLTEVDVPVTGGAVCESFEHAVTLAIKPSMTTPVAAQRILVIVVVPFR